MKKIFLMLCLVVLPYFSMAEELPNGWCVESSSYGIGIIYDGGCIFRITGYPLNEAQEICVKKEMSWAGFLEPDSICADFDIIHDAPRDSVKWFGAWLIPEVEINENHTGIVIKMTMGFCNFDSVTFNITEVLAAYPKGFLSVIKFGNSNSVSTVDDPESAAAQFVLYQNYPNPFNPATTIRYTLANTAHVSLIIVNEVGQTVARMINRVQQPGEYSIIFDGSGIASGAYIYGLVIDDVLYPPGFLMFLSK